MKHKTLHISEVFSSIQGEGQTAGHRAVFLRLTGCNLLCQSKNWICDTIEVWRKGNKTIFENVFEKHHIEKLRLGAHLIITGGEPLLHQDSIIDYLTWFGKHYGFHPIIEIETNGTIIPKAMMQSFVDYWNCSPKLENSGEPFEKRVKPLAIGLIQQQENSIFKFVVNKEIDAISIFQDYPMIKGEKIWLMPAGENREQLNKTRPVAINLSQEFNLNYSDRLHIVIWNKKTGV